jgi:archaellum component FlaF (FlaF/FlaG flagellin family)
MTMNGTTTRILTLLACTALSAGAFAQQGFGPLDPSEPTGITVAQIIEKMGRQETAFETARNEYTFRQTVKMDTISDDTNKPDGEYQQVTDITFADDGRRAEHVVFAPQNTIQRVIITESDMKDIEQRLPFVLTTAQLPEYNLTYLGKVWVDQQDDEIVLVNGINVPQDTRKGHEDLSPPFTTYYQQIDGQYWFPTYTKAEGVLHFAAQSGALSQDVHMRTTVKYTDYKRFHTNVTIHYNGEVLAKPDPNQAPPPPK